MVQLEAEEIMRLTVKVADPKIVSTTGCDRLQVIPIIGGAFTGKKIHGKVVPGGADWNTTHSNGISHVFAKYLLETDDGEFIAIENEGLLGTGSETRIKTKPVFRADTTGQYSHLNHGVYVGELMSTPDATNSVDIVIYKLR